MAELLNASKKVFNAEIPFIGVTVGATVLGIAGVQLVGKLTGWWDINPFAARGEDALEPGQIYQYNEGTRAKYAGMGAAYDALDGVGGIRIGPGVKAKFTESKLDNMNLLAKQFGQENVYSGYTASGTTSNPAWKKGDVNPVKRFFQRVMN